jgi:hypothetical protein
MICCYQTLLVEEWYGHNQRSGTALEMGEKMNKYQRHCECRKGSPTFWKNSAKLFPKTGHAGATVQKQRCWGHGSVTTLGMDGRVLRKHREATENQMVYPIPLRNCTIAFVLGQKEHLELRCPILGKEPNKQQRSSGQGMC